MIGLDGDAGHGTQTGDAERKEGVAPPPRPRPKPTTTSTAPQHTAQTSFFRGAVGVSRANPSLFPSEGGVRA